jgi:hypothetical protein
MKAIILFPLIFSMTDQKGMNVEIRQVNDSTRMEIWHRNDSILFQRIFKYKQLK